MNTKEFLDKVAYIGEMDTGFDGEKSKVYLSKFDNSYITHVGMEEKVRFLAEREITEQLTHGVGFSPKDKKWYGWSHRAIYGFGIGSTCKKGDCHYVGSNEEEQKEAAIEFWKDKYHKNVRCTGIRTEGISRYFIIEWDYGGDVPNKKLRNTVGSTDHFITPTGRGEWTAETMGDAKQMAIDFNAGVS